MNWQKLKIDWVELEEILNFDLKSTLAIEIGRVLFLKRRGYWFLWVTEISGLFLVCLLLFPVVLIIFRNFDWLSNNTAGLILVFAIASIISLLFLLGLNYYLWQRAKQLKVLVLLLDKIEQYDSLIDNLILLSQLNTVTDNKIEDDKISELKTALHLTRNSLIKSIELEKIIGRDRHFANNRYQLLTNLETGLINLDSLAQTNNDYHQLYSEAIDLGLSVHRELRKKLY